MAARVCEVRGRAAVLRGNDIDTDRIIPARYLRCVTFDGLGEHAFADDRAQAKGEHALDQKHFAGAALLLVGANFGCGSSREHAPQSLSRAGFRAFLGESFAEIFAGNCTALGLPCVTLAREDLHALMDAVELDPEQELHLDLETQTVRARGKTFRCTLREDARRALTGGAWNATAVLREAEAQTRATAGALPYLRGFEDATPR